MACVFATTKTHHNENSTRRSSGQPTRYFIALRIVLFHMLNWFALCCGPLGHQDPIFISYIPDLKHWKTDMSGFWQTTGKRKFQPQAFPWKILCQRSVSDSSSTAALTIFSPAEKCCQVAEFCTIWKVPCCSAHPGCIYIAVRSFTDVGQLRVPQPGALYVHLLHNQATLEVSTVHTVHTDGVLSRTIPLF